MATVTIEQLEETTGITVDPHLERQLDIPVLTGTQRQGDTIIIPGDKSATTQVPVDGFPVVRGENGGNTHSLHGIGPVFFDPHEATVSDLKLGTLTVPEGSTAVLAHPEHAFNQVGPGNYTIRRQREQADELRMVAD